MTFRVWNLKHPILEDCETALNQPGRIRLDTQQL